MRDTSATSTLATRPSTGFLGLNIVSASPSQRLYYRYYLGPDHPAKLRLCRYLRRIMSPGRITVAANRVGTVVVDEQDFVERHLLVHGCYEPEVLDSLMCFAECDEVVWDVGAHVGSFTLPAMRDNRVAMAYAFEPMPEAFCKLSENVALNAGRSMLINCALGDQRRILPLFCGPVGNSGMASALSGSDPVAVNCFTADWLIESGYLKAPTLMKLDVEGFELQVLKGSANMFQQQPPKAVVFEAQCDSDGRVTSSELMEFFRTYGFGIERIARPQAEVEPRENYVAWR